jgi:hypothetical protein
LSSSVSSLRASAMGTEPLWRRLRLLHLFLSLASLFTGAASDITCRCTRCEAKNQSCTASGQCVFYASRESENGVWTETYGCVTRDQQADLCKSEHTLIWYNTCCKKDRCNYDLKLPEDSTPQGERLIGNTPERKCPLFRIFVLISVWSSCS